MNGVLQGKDKKIVLIGILFSLLIFMGIGYAILSTTLNLKTVTKLSGVWDIKIVSMEVKSTTGLGEDVSHSFDGLTATFDVNLYAPGDSVEYEITIKNNGNIKASLSQMTSSVTPKYENIELSNTLTQGEVLAPNETRVFTVKSEFDKSATSLPETEISPEYTIELLYYQYEGNNITTPPDISSDNICFTVFSDGTLGEYDYSCGLDVTVPATVNGIAVTNISQNSFGNDAYMISKGYIKIRNYSYFNGYMGRSDNYYFFETKEDLETYTQAYNENPLATALNGYYYLVGNPSDYYTYNNAYYSEGFDAEGNAENDNPVYIIYWCMDDNGDEYFIIEDQAGYDAAVIYLKNNGYDESYLYVAGDPNIPYNYRTRLDIAFETANDKENILFWKNKKNIQSPKEFIKTLDLSNAVNLTTISTFGFESLTSLKFPDSSLTTIGDQSFNRAALNEVIIPSSVTKIGTAAFASMPSGSVIKIRRKNSTGLTLGTKWNGSATIKYIG